MERTRVTWKLIGLALLACSATTGEAEAQAQEELAERGRKIAEQHCIRCHVVTEENLFTGISSTPSFRLLVTALPDWQERFETFYQRRPHPALVRFRGEAAPSADEPPSPTVNLMADDVDAIVAFAESLHDKYGGSGAGSSR